MSLVAPLPSPETLAALSAHYQERLESLILAVPPGEPLVEAVDELEDDMGAILEEWEGLDAPDDLVLAANLDETNYPPVAEFEVIPAAEIEDDRGDWLGLEVGFFWP